MIAYKPVPLRLHLGQTAPPIPQMPQGPANISTPPSSWSVAWENTKRIWIPGVVLTLLAAGAYMGISSGRRATDRDDKDTHLYYGVGSLALGILYISQLISDRSK